MAYVKQLLRFAELDHQRNENVWKRFKDQHTNRRRVYLSRKLGKAYRSCLPKLVLLKPVVKVSREHKADRYKYKFFDDSWWNDPCKFLSPT